MYGMASEYELYAKLREREKKLKFMCTHEHAAPIEYR